MAQSFSDTSCILTILPSFVHFLVALLADITGVESRPEAVTDLLKDTDFMRHWPHDFRYTGRPLMARTWFGEV